MARFLTIDANGSSTDHKPTTEHNPFVFYWTLVIPLLILAVFLNWSLGHDPDPALKSRLDNIPNQRHPAELWKGGFWGLGDWYADRDRPMQNLLTTGLIAVVISMIGLLRRWNSFPLRTNFGLCLSGGALLLLIGFGLYLQFDYLDPYLATLQCPDLLATVGPPITLIIFYLACTIEVMLLNRIQTEYEFEWRQRLNASFLMLSIAWSIFFGITFHLPRAISWVSDHSQSIAPAMAAIGSWLITTLLGVVAGRRHHEIQEQSNKNSWWQRIVLVIAPPVFLIGSLAMISELVTCILGPVVSAPGTFWNDVIALCACGLVFAIATLLVDVNRFSLHALYANRLTRCYLGASLQKSEAGESYPGGGLRGGAPTGVSEYRRDNFVTGFDPADDIPLSSLYADASFRGPYPLLNASLQLVGGDELALQDRLACPFMLSPLFCGSNRTGYAYTPGSDGSTSSYKENLTLGRAMAISGAAIDSNMPNFHSVALTVMLTMFNARLGWWLANPARSTPKSWTARGPGIGWPLFAELLGLTDASGWFVRLSDGGHFENLGAYELIRRRCRFVVACDFAEDNTDVSMNLANLIRLVRTDFGIRIEMDTTPLRKTEHGLSQWHVAVGIIRYEDRYPNAMSGTIIFIRSSLTGDEPADVGQYRANHPEFPHEGTINQFFDDKQFESYRQLGDHLAHSIFNPLREPLRFDLMRTPATYRHEVQKFFSRLRTHWFPSSPRFEKDFGELVKSCEELMSVFRDDEMLYPLASEIYPELGLPNKLSIGPFVSMTAERHRHELLTLTRVLDLMEVAWMRLRLDDNALHPVNQGWMSAFRRWTAAPSFHRYWPILRGEYGREFVRFCEGTLNLESVTPKVVRFNPELHQKHLESLQQEFHLEWGSLLQSTPELQSLLVQFVTPTHPPWPLAYLLTIEIISLQADQPSLNYPIGIIAVRSVRDEATPSCLAELMLWIRGSYRSMGYGTQCLEDRLEGEPLFQFILRQLGQLVSNGERKYLITRYPRTRPLSAQRLQQDLWTNLFYDHDFRKQPFTMLDDSSRPFIVLERELQVTT